MFITLLTRGQVSLAGHHIESINASSDLTVEMQNRPDPADKACHPAENDLAARLTVWGKRKLLSVQLLGREIVYVWDTGSKIGCLHLKKKWL